jgi:outer membrane receptor protein involved in Fe transport
MSFDLLHFADGLENYGPETTPASESETAFTPKVGLSWQATPNDLYYATYAKGFRPGGGNPGLPPFCGPGLIQEGYTSGKAPPTYDSDTTQSYEIGSKNAFASHLKLATSLYYIKWNGIQQNVYVAGACGLQFTDNLGTAVAKGFDMQAELAIGAGWSLEASFGYTSARYTENSPRAGLALAGDAISGEAAINYAPGTNPPWTVAVGPQYSFSVADREAFVRLDWEYAARNPWLAAVQDPRSSQYDPNSFTTPATTFMSLRGGLNLGRFQVSLFCDNLANTRTITSYAQVQIDANNPSYQANPTLPTSVQQNNYMFRPRTIGITASYKN